MQICLTHDYITAGTHGLHCCHNPNPLCLFTCHRLDVKRQRQRKEAPCHFVWQLRACQAAGATLPPFGRGRQAPLPLLSQGLQAAVPSASARALPFARRGASCAPLFATAAHALPLASAARAPAWCGASAPPAGLGSCSAARPLGPGFARALLAAMASSVYACGSALANTLNASRIGR